ncbi:MAG: hypothetical protein IID33_10845 [Planctomycetes bacterium]|nr:hypothetical protein [Planctomycetota bacterium]
MTNTTSSAELGNRVEQLVAEHIAAIRRAAEAALERAFAESFAETDDSNVALEAEVETVDRPAVHLPAETAMAAVIEPRAAVAPTAEPEFEWPEAKMIADAPVSPVDLLAVEYDVWLAEIAPIISLAADMLTLPDSDAMAEWGAALNEFGPVEAGAAVITSEAVQETISALLVEAEYMAELLFAIQDDMEPDHAFELTAAIDAIISEQLFEVTALDEWRCELLDQEMALEIQTGD